MRRDSTLYLHLAARLDALRDGYVRLLRERIPFYQAIPEEHLLPAAEAFMRVFVEETVATWDKTPIVTWSLDYLRAHAPQGLTFEGAMGLATYFRRVVLRAIEPLFDERVEGVHRLVMLIDDVCETIVDASAKFYADALERAQKELQASEERYRGLIEASPDGVGVYRDGRLLYVNPAGLRIFGVEDLVGREIVSVLVPEIRERWRAAVIAAEQVRQPTPPAEASVARPDGRPTTVEMTGVSILYEGLPARQVVFRDITERKQAEVALQRAAVQEGIIRAQEATLREVSTPLIPVSDGVVVMPLVGLVDRVRAEQMRQVLLSGISSASAKVAILDVTGVPSMDAAVAQALLSAVSAARLLGAEVVLTGIKPAAAQALVGLGVDFGNIVTRGTLKDGIAHALARARR